MTADRSLTQYIAFLRGINSGRNPLVKMDVLRRAFEEFGFKNVTTYIASGNVIFEAQGTSLQALENRIEKGLPKAIGFASPTTVTTRDALQRLFDANPFRKIRTTPQTKLYATFLKRKPEGLRFPVRVKGFTILGIFDGAVCSVVDLSRAKTPDLMSVLDKEFGRDVTTRSWGTIEGILRAASGKAAPSLLAERET